MDITSAKVGLDIAKFVVEILKTMKSAPEVGPDVSDKLQDHLNYESNWCQESEVFSFDEDPIDSSISMGFSTPKKYRLKRSSPSDCFLVLNEEEILSSNDSFIIFGGPGSGKTTTIKRLIQYLILTDNSEFNCGNNYPLLIRFRALKDHESVVTKLAEICSLVVDTKIREEIVGYRKEKNGEDVPIIKQIKEHYCGGKPLLKCLARFLDQTNALVLLDGLDELQSVRLKDIVDEIEDLRLHVKKSRLIITCRSNGYAHSITGFKPIEILALSESDIVQICKISAVDSSAFITALRSKSYIDLASRPLFLRLMILYFRAADTLPDKPIDIYRKMVTWSLSKWDLEKGILSRNSAYANFDNDKKLDFLSELSFYLTYQIDRSLFDNSLLVSTYKTMYKKYGLALSEAEDVAREIESHTGLLIEASEGQFEFSHFSIQEFLAANYLKSIPPSIDFENYLSKKPEPLAIALAMVPDASGWLAFLIFGWKPNKVRSIPVRSYIVLLERIITEKPYFERSKALGFVVLFYLFNVLQNEDSKIFYDFLAMDNVCISAADALKAYFVRSSSISESAVHLQNPIYVGGLLIKPPKEGKVLKGYFDFLMTSQGLYTKQLEHENDVSKICGSLDDERIN